MVGPKILGSTPSLQKRFGRNCKIKMNFPAPIDCFLIRWDPIQSF